MEDFIVIDIAGELFAVAYSVNKEQICLTDSKEKALLICDALNEYFKTP